MKVASALLLAPALANAAYYSRDMYESGEVHQMIIDMKNVCCPLSYLLPLLPRPPR